MCIEKKIASWDGKSSNVINAIYSRHSSDVGFISDIIELAQLVPLQKGATWLLKHHLESGWEVKESQTSQLFSLLPNLKHWETKLHLLQSLPYLAIAHPEKKTVEHFLRQCLTHENKFVRAWAYNGFYLLSVQYAEYTVETKQIFDMAMRDEAPSVKARIRNIIKQGF